MINRHNGKDSIYGILDSIIYRGAIAVISLILASVVDFESLGFYATVTLVLGLYQALFEGLIRNISGKFFLEKNSSNEIKKIAIVGSAAFGLLILFVIVGTGLRHGIKIETALSAFPVALTPFFLGLSSFQQRVAQTNGEWRRLALARVWSTIPVFLICLSGIYYRRDLLFPSLFLPCTEILLYFSLRKHQPVNVATGLRPESFLEKREIGGMFIFQASSWVKAQADRLVLAIVASAQTMGIYFVASSISRVPAEMINYGLLGQQRSMLTHAKSVSDKKLITNKRLLLHTLVSITAYTISIGTSLLLKEYLPRFSDVVALIPILAIATFASTSSAVVWTSAINEEGSLGKNKSQIWNTLFVSIAAFIASLNLPLGCMFLAGREVLNSIWIFVRWRNFFNFKFLLPTICLTLVAVVVSAYFFLGSALS